jgi:two-component system, LuxR family, response regulator FixJ
MTQQIDSSIELFVVDDDASMRDLLGVMFTHEGYQVTAFEEGTAFLAAARTRTPSCIILDVHMPGRSGIDILKELDAQHYGAPVFIISAQGDIPLAVDAVKNGAFDFIEKPFETGAVVTRVRRAIAGWKSPPANGEVIAVQSQRYPGQDRLTPREREVLSQIAGGASNKEAGRRLNISPRTVEVHRARIMDKLKAKNAADLVRIVLTQGNGV